MQPKAIIAIPYYNHPATLRDVTERCLAVHPHVLVVDDGSETPADALVADLDVRIERHPENKGKGEAILTAGRIARELELTHVVTIDADGQHDPADIPRFLEAIDADPYALFVGNRIFEGDDVPGSSKFGRKFSNFWFRLQTGQTLKDCQSGFRAYPVPVLVELSYMFRTYAFEVEVLVRSAWAGVACKDIDISVYYPPEKERVSHFNKFWDNVRLTMLNTHLTGRSITPWPHQKLDYGPGRDGKRQKITILHPFRSLRTLLTENTTPAELSKAAALGIFLGALPLILCHTIVIMFACTFFRANKPFAFSIHQLCTPPFVPALCIEVGYFMRHGRFLTEFTMETLGYQALYRLWDWFLGSLIVGPILAGIVALIVFVIAHNMQKAIIATRRKNKGRAVE